MLRCAKGGGTAPARALCVCKLRLRECDGMREPVRRLIFLRNDSSLRMGTTKDGGDWDSALRDAGVLGRWALRPGSCCEAGRNAESKKTSRRAAILSSLKITVREGTTVSSSDLPFCCWRRWRRRYDGGLSAWSQSVWVARNPVRRLKKKKPCSLPPAHLPTQRASSRQIGQRFCPVVTREARIPATIRVFAASISALI